MNEEINLKINSLKEEAESLLLSKDQLLAQVQQIDIRIHQIVGAVRALDELIKTTNKPTQE